MRSSKTMLHPYSKNPGYVACTVQLRTNDTMQTQPRFNTLGKNDIDSRAVMRDKITSMMSIWYMAKHKAMDHNTMASADST